MNIKEQDTKLFSAGKPVIHLKSETLVKFEDPVPLKSRKQALRGLRYTTLEKLMQAKYVDDL